MAKKEVCFMSKRIVCLLLTIAFIVSVAGCATIFKQKSKTVSFNSDPQGAVVYINGNRMGRTPMPLNLSNKKSVTVTFKKEGYEAKTYIINTETRAGWVILDICAGPFGFIAVIIDAVTKNWYSLDTDAVKVMLDVERK